MRLKKTIVILLVFLLLTIIFNFNSVAFQTINKKEKAIFNDYIIQLNDEPTFSFINRLRLITKNMFLNLTENEKFNFISQKINEYKEKLISIHKTIKEDILKLSGKYKSYNEVFTREFFELFNGIYIKKVSTDIIAKLKNHPLIKNVFPTYNIYATLDVSVPLINADYVWNLKDDFGKNITGQGVTIAFLDTGVDYNHPDLRDNYISEGSYDFVNNDDDPMDDNGHGTHVTGIAVGKGIESNYQYVGVAPDAKFYSFKILKKDGEGNFSTYYDAMMRALDPNNDGDYSDKVDIVSLSFGTKEPGNPDDSLCQVLDNVVKAGVTVVVAAGNLGPGPSTITSPGCARLGICVGSTNKNDIIASSSSRGPVEWNGDYMEKPDVVAPGVSIKSTKNKGGYEVYSGTSMSTPHIAGAVALILQANSKFDPTNVKQLLKTSALDLGYNVNTQGNGRINLLNIIKTDKQLVINAPDIVNEAQIFKISLLDINNDPVRAWTLFITPYHIPRLKFGSSGRFVAPIIICKNNEFVKGKIIAFRFQGGLEIVKKDILIVNNVRINN